MSKKKPKEWLLRDNWHFAFKEFPETLKKTIVECPDLKKTNELLFIIGWIYATFIELPNFIVDGKVTKEYSHKLTFTCFMDLMRTTNCTIFLIGCGLYKNAYHNIRYALESIVHSLYMDLRHPNADFGTKIEILDEVEDLNNYRGVNLLKALDIHNKEEIMREYKRINKEYKKLSKKVHFTYRQLLVTAKLVTDGNVHSTKMDCNEVSKIYNSMKTVYDLVIFLILTYFPSLEEPLSKNAEFIKTVKDHNLTLTCRVLKIPV